MLQNSILVGTKEKLFFFFQYCESPELFLLEFSEMIHPRIDIWHGAFQPEQFKCGNCKEFKTGLKGRSFGQA